MSESYSVFINKKASLNEIKACLENILNSTLNNEGSEWDIYITNILGLEIMLLEAVGYEEEEEDDIKLSDYSYYVSVDYLPHAFDEIYIDDWRMLTSIIIGNMISKRLNCKCLVLKNMQKIIETFLPE